MNKVNVKTAELLSKITANRDAHRSLFEKALVGYRQDVIEELDKMLADAKAGKDIKTIVALRAPEDHTDDYNRVITMLQMSTEPVVEIDSHQFDMFVMDNWSWKEHVTASNMFYAAKAAR